MRNRRFLRRLTGLSMAVILTSVSFEVNGLYANDEQDLLSVPVIQEVQLESKAQGTKDFEHGILSKKGQVGNKTTGYIDIGHVATSIKNKNSLSLDTTMTIPSSYNSAEKGYVTSVKDQSIWGTCWAFAACAAMESYAISHGLVDSADDVDFSEYALAYLTFSDDMYMDKTGDYTYTTDEYVGFDSGGNDEYAFKALSKWTGIYNDDNISYGNSVSTGEVAEYIPDEADIDFVLTGQYYISTSDREQIKTAIMENGAATCSYYSDYAYSKDNELYNYNYEYEGTNHAVTLVGWDDNKDKNLFTMTDSNGIEHTPTNNGAWLFKNSWGTYYGDEGYCWISYEDMGFNSGDVVVYEIAPKEDYDNIYQYDGATLFLAPVWGVDFAAIYEIEGDVEQTIDAVSFATYSANTNYTVKIYKNTDSEILDEGELLTTQTGSTTFEGYYTVMLDDVVTLSPGDSVSIIISFAEGAYVIQEYSGFPMGMYQDTYTVCTSQEGRTYRRLYTGDSFSDCSEGGDLCIKAFTSDVGESVDAPRITGIDDSDISKLVVKWQEVEGAISYTLWKGESMDDANAVLIENLTDNSYEDTDVVIGNTYYYKVCAVLVDETTDYGSVKSATVEIKAPTLTGAQDGDTVELTWEEVSYADGYKIYRSIDGGAYELIKNVENTVTSYTESGLEFGVTYTYAVCVYVTIDGQYYESGKGLTYTATREVPMVEDFYIDGRFYNKMLLTWSVSEGVDGYNIYSCIGDETSWIWLTSVDADVTEYSYDVSDLEEGTYCYFAVQPYVIVDGQQYVNQNYYYDYSCVGEPPLEVYDIKWYIEDNYLAVKFKAEESEDGYTIWYDDNDYYDNYVDVTGSPDEEGYVMEYIYLYDYEQMPIYITDYWVERIFQETPFNVSGEYQAPKLNYINDVILDSGVTTTTLTATITNKMENFEYLYQWYVSDTPTGTATAIEGATSNVYTATVAADEEKYYYCSVICRHEEEYIVNTTNSLGNRTKVAGSEPQVVTVSDIANQTYTGSAITPSVTVTKGTKTLTSGTDYTLSYTDNVNAGTATVTVTFKGNYAGTPSASKTFTITPRGISDVTITYTKEYNYTGSAIKPTPTVKNSIGTLVNGTDYTLSYSNNVNVGTATMTLTFKGNYTGSKSVTFTIKDPIPTSITSSTYSVNQSSLNISKITVGTTAGTFLNGLKEKQYVVIKNGNSTVSSTTALATGMKACIMNGSTVTKTYTIIVTGDTNGDGKINITDMIAVKANILKKSTLSGAYAKAADVNGDGKINITDFIKVKATLLKKDSIIGVVAK